MSIFVIVLKGTSKMISVVLRAGREGLAVGASVGCAVGVLVGD
jgi:hypothetical protein